MAVLVVIFAVIMSMASPAYSLNCTTQKFSNRVFRNCSDLPVLSSILHWTYNSSASKLSIAFTAPPAAPAGWVSWAINPDGPFMAGAQSLVAFKESGSVVVRPFVLNNYSSIVQTDLSYRVSDASAEEVNGVLTIFATFQLPEKKTKFYHIWQVGASVAAGRPAKHEFKEANLNAKGTFYLMAEEVVSGGAPAPSPTGSPSLSPGGDKSGESGIRQSSMGFYFLLLFGSFSMAFCF